MSSSSSSSSVAPASSPAGAATGAGAPGRPAVYDDSGTYSERERERFTDELDADVRTDGGQTDLSEVPSALSGTSSRLNDADSLVDASPEEVEARAMELLSMHKINKEHVTAQDNATASPPTSDNVPPAVMTVDDLPRKPLGEPELETRSREAAVAFLRKCVDELDDTDWQYTTPPAFRPPGPLDPKRLRDQQALATDTAWMETAFNLDQYGLAERYEPATEHCQAEQDHPDDRGSHATVLEMEDPSASTLEFADFAPASFGNGAYGTPFTRDGEVDPSGAGRSHF